MEGRETNSRGNDEYACKSEPGKRGVALCHNCGNENPETFIFCSSCGVRISRLCPYCKEVHNVFVPLCPRTGEPIPGERETSRKGRKAKKSLALSACALALGGAMLFLNPVVKNNVPENYSPRPISYYYAANPVTPEITPAPALPEKPVKGGPEVIVPCYSCFPDPYPPRIEMTPVIPELEMKVKTR